MSQTILMIHGMMQTGKCWDNYVKYFTARGYHCVAVNLRHHALAQRDAPDTRLGTLSLLDYVADLEAQIKQMPDLPIIMGHSMGGLIAQLLAARGLAKSLIFITSAPPAQIVAISPANAYTFSEHLLTWRFWTKPFRVSQAKASFGFLNNMPPETHEALYSDMVYESGRAAAEIGFPFTDSQKAARVEPSKVQCPVLAIGAKKDRATPAAVVKKNAALYAQATYIEYADHAHWIIGEAGWDKVCDDILQWLQTRAGKENTHDYYLHQN